MSQTKFDERDCFEGHFRKKKKRLLLFLSFDQQCGWLLLKCSVIGIGFNGAETNCGIAHILGILLMNSCNTDIL